MSPRSFFFSIFSAYSFYFSFFIFSIGVFKHNFKSCLLLLRFDVSSLRGTTDRLLIGLWSDTMSHGNDSSMRTHIETRISSRSARQEDRVPCVLSSRDSFGRLVRLKSRKKTTFANRLWDQATQRKEKRDS